MSSDPRHDPDSSRNLTRDVTQSGAGIRQTEAPTVSMNPATSSTGGHETVRTINTRHHLAEHSRFDDCGEIGVGGMGTVRAVQDQVLLRRVAMKSLHPDLAANTEHTQRFLEEVQIASQLDHPHIVPVHDLGVHPDGSAFFVMKLVQGQTLGKLLEREAGQPLPGRRLEEYLQIFLKVCDAIDFAHSRGVIHRDLKPSNVMVGDHGEVYVMDWGIALLHESPRKSDPHHMPRLGRPTKSHRESAGSLMGTAAYMAPEQAAVRIQDIDFRTDIFGLGAILYELLTARPPYVAENPAIQLELARAASILPPAQVAQGRRLPAGLCRITMKALSNRREDRHQSVRELKDDVLAFLRGGGWFEPKIFPPGTIIVREGDEPDVAYIIEDGCCEVYKGTGADRRVLRRLGPGDVFGETAIFTGQPRTASVIAVDQVRTVAITRETLDCELAEKGWVGVFVKALAERFCEYDEALAKLR